MAPSYRQVATQGWIAGGDGLVPNGSPQVARPRGG